MSVKNIIIVIVALFGITLSTQLFNAYKDYKEAAKQKEEQVKEIIVDGETNNAIKELTDRIVDNEKITKDSMGIFDALEEQARQLKSSPPPVHSEEEVEALMEVYGPEPDGPIEPVPPPVVLGSTQEKVKSHVEPKEMPVPSSDNTRSIAALAIDGLWEDFCRRFNDDPHCRKRQGDKRQMPASAAALAF